MSTTPQANTEAQAPVRTLRVADPRFDEILANANDAIISIDESQAITLFNRGAQRIFGYSEAEILGQPLNRLIPERTHYQWRLE